jgi:hypothetical protein
MRVLGPGQDPASHPGESHRGMRVAVVAAVVLAETGLTPRVRANPALTVTTGGSCHSAYR